jgi:hypothetical protein
VLDFAYQDFWQPSTDGQGRSLEIADPANDPSDPLNWRASRRIGGTPGAPPLGGVKILNLIVEASALKLTFLAEAGVGYIVQWSDAIDRGQWEPERTLDPPLDDTIVTLDVPRKPEAPSGFLRLEAH